MITELIAAKRREQLSVPYVNRLEDDLKSFAAVVPDEIEKVHAPHIKEFLNACKVGPRRWNNLRDQIVRFSVSRVRSVICQKIARAKRKT